MQHEWVEQVLLVIQTALALAFVFEIVKPDTRSLQGFGVVCEMEAGKVAIRSDACQSRLLFHAWVDGPIRVRRAVIIAESNQRPDFQANFFGRAGSRRVHSESPRCSRHRRETRSSRSRCLRRDM